MVEVVGATPDRALAIYAHPDDPEVSCGGTMARWAADGCEVHVLVCTRGEKGTTDPAIDPDELAARRASEAAAAARVLGVAGHHHLGLPDGELADSNELRGLLVGYIRRLRPEAVFCPDPTAVLFGEDYFNHRDHRITGFAALDALAPASALPHYFPETGPPHRVGVAYLSGTLEPTVWVDVTDTIDAKVAAVTCHTSQLADPDAPEWATRAVRLRAEEEGRRAGVAFAEAFRRLRPNG